jgi:molybdenum cofactor cytidylyltransferase
VTRVRVGLVLAAGSSRRLGTPKQLLPVGDATLLDATLDTARRCGFDQLLVTVGGAADQVRASVDLAGVQVVESPVHTEGCASSIRAAVEHVDPRADGFVLLLGDQPHVTAASVDALLDAGRGHALGVCRYDDGRGHPLWLGRATFDELRELRGDKAVWKLLEGGAHEVVEVVRPGRVPLDVDTRDDHARLLAEEATGGR